MEAFAHIDDFWKGFKTQWEKHLLASGKKPRGPEPEMSMSEIMTLVILFHQSHSRTFKDFYAYVAEHLLRDFPTLVSYPRLVVLQKRVIIPLFAYLLSLKGQNTGVAFIDSTSIAVCKNKRIARNKVFKGFAKRGKTSMGWFYGFKLHLIINEQGEIEAFQVTPGNVSDVTVAEGLAKGLMGKLFGDKGYISSSLGESLLKQGLELFTNVRSNMKQKFMSLQDKLLLRKRFLIETVNDQLKNISQIEHSRHRSIDNFLVNLLAGLAAYCRKPKKPSITAPHYSTDSLAVA
jgi:hypothetical protein